jgi:hypothetical protein
MLTPVELVWKLIGTSVPFQSAVSKRAWPRRNASGYHQSSSNSFAGEQTYRTPSTYDTLRDVQGRVNTRREQASIDCTFVMRHSP